MSGVRNRDWIGAGGRIGEYIRRESKATLAAYRQQPSLVKEQANQEEDAARGGYAHRQLIELVQNSADQLTKSDGRRIHVQLTQTHLYCADNGRPIDKDGAKALLFSHLSPKRSTVEIGRFGIGFKSVLGVSDRPAVFSRSGSFQFDRADAAERIRRVAPRVENCPVLRIAESINPQAAAKSDSELRLLMDWAVNIVRLPLKPGARDDLVEQIRDFAPEFLLFVPHVHQLDLVPGSSEPLRALHLTTADGVVELSDGQSSTHWMIFDGTHELSQAARDDSRTLDDAGAVKIVWAAPLSRGINHQQFWAFFPTQTSSLVAGILNAPWKTNEDRQSLLPGVYNDELLGAAAQLVADALPKLSNPDAPARHLDALPRREESGDNRHANKLRSALFRQLRHAAVLPDQRGALCRLSDLRLPPGELTPGQRVETEILARWGAYAHHPTAWLHTDALISTRLAAIGRIYAGGRPSYGAFERFYRDSRAARQGPPRASVAEWLESLVESGVERGDAAGASMAAIQAAALFPERLRSAINFGNIVLTAAGGRKRPGPDGLYLSGDSAATSVHPDLEADPETLNALKLLGVRPPSAESRLRGLAALLAPPEPGEDASSDERWGQFWECVRQCDNDTALGVIDSSFQARAIVRVKTEEGTWEPVQEVLLPGSIVTADGDDQGYVVVDIEFHEADLHFLSELGVVAEPHGNYSLTGPYYSKYTEARRNEFREAANGRPQLAYLEFDVSASSGPLDVFQYLSDRSKAKFSDALLNLEATFQLFTMRHVTQPRYEPKRFRAPAIRALREQGRVAIGNRILLLKDGLGKEPKSCSVQRWLLEHPNTSRIRRAFPDLVSDFGSDAEPIGDDERIPLLDVWPGLRQALSVDANPMLIRCDRIVDARGNDLPMRCVSRGDDVLLVRMNAERAELEAIVRELGLDVDGAAFDEILRRATQADVDRARSRVGAQRTDAERLLAAVSQHALRRRLPATLIAILDQRAQPFAGVRVAEAAMATFHTGALKEYRHDIQHLDPPMQWAGGQRALEFVASLGFGPEWAGQPAPKREQFLVVRGPRSLPDLHDYQKVAVGHVKEMLTRRDAEGENRGLLSLPTGSGKTRVAVQAVIEAIRDDGLNGVLLWVADRDELCEQAVEAWQQAWASIGPEAKQLRISRWWAGHRQPQGIDGAHVIVATIQTLRARLDRSSDSTQVLADVSLLVVDEAHGSIAPSYTQLMSELGLTFRRAADEICLLGLTATPYRGRDEVETERLVNRYGRNRLDAGAFDSDEPQEVIAQLQEMTVLAEVDHQTIKGERLTLSPAELRQIEERHLPWLPESVEQRIAESANRTQGIVDAYMSQVRAIDAEAPTLIFATSVEHSKTVAAMLKLEGVEARAVSGETDSAVRRSVVEQFRSGEVTVLVNYGVFREGFDAPRTRAIIVARPVYSPNLYFQMIGRGLRGKLNGGSERCLILDVEDNIENYDRALAFSELDWLWS